MKKPTYVPKEYTPFKYKVPGVRLPSFNDKQLDRKTGKPITVCHPALYRIVGIAPVAAAFVTGILMVCFPNVFVLFVLFPLWIIWTLLYAVFGNLLFRWEPDPLPDREFFEAKDSIPTVHKSADARNDK